MLNCKLECYKFLQTMPQNQSSINNIEVTCFPTTQQESQVFQFANSQLSDPPYYAGKQMICFLTSFGGIHKLLNHLILLAPLTMQYTLEFFIKYIDAEMDKRYTKLQKKKCVPEKSIFIVQKPSCLLVFTFTLIISLHSCDGVRAYVW